MTRALRAPRLSVGLRLAPHPPPLPSAHLAHEGSLSHVREAVDTRMARRHSVRPNTARSALRRAIAFADERAGHRRAVGGGCRAKV